MKRFLATLMVVAMMISTMTVGTIPAAAVETDDAASKYVTLDGEWHFKLYRTYANMYQYFAYAAAMAKGTWTDTEAAKLPETEVWKSWETVSLPADNPETGGLLNTLRPGVEVDESEATLEQKLFPSWSEAWLVKEFDLPEDFTEDDTVTLLMGIIDDNDVIYINGQAVAASGFVDGNGTPIMDVPELGGFVYDKSVAAEDQVKWAKSYWEVQREYTIPADVLNLGGTNVIAIRAYNNNGFGGLYSGHVYALCGNKLAVRNLKGLPTEIAQSDEVDAIVAEQVAALKAGDINAYAATIDDNYHNDAEDKADKVAKYEAIVAAGDISVEDVDATTYIDDEGYYWYSAERTIYSGDEAVYAENIEQCYEVADGAAVERGNWNRCYGTNYASELFKQNLTYSVYLPPSYYTDAEKEYPVVWLLHGRASSSTSYRDVDKIGAFMDEQIASGNIMEMVLIMPDSGKYAFYQDSELKGTDKDNTGPWATQLTEELRGVAQDIYRIKTEAEYNGLTGNSMGGYGSMMIGTSNPELYSSIAVHMGHLPADALASLQGLTAEQLEAYDFYLDAGLQDATVGYKNTVAVHDYLDSVGKEHVYSLREGGHNSAFYMSGMPASMKMHSDHFQKNMNLEEASKYINLDGEWHHKLYRTYAKMFQYFPYMPALAAGKWTDAEAAVYPAGGAWKSWDTVQMPDDNPELGGLLNDELSPTWSESWVVREFDLPMDFADSEEVTLLMGIIDDNDVIYINGQAVAASGFVNGSGQPIIDVPDTGGFNYDKNAAAEDQVKWSKSYWEIQREYTIPTDVLNLGGTNEIAVRVYNNNSNGGFYSGNLYALCGNELAVRNVKGLPIEKAESDEVMTTVEAQIAALEAGDSEAFAATVADNYHNDADDKAARVAQVEELMAQGELSVEDTNAVIYVDDEGNFWYSAQRTITVNGTSSTETIELCYQVSGGQAQEIGNWSRCYGTSYASDLFGQDLTYSVYLPPSYYTDTKKDYPVVWLLHGRASSSTSYRDVDNIGAFMDEQIASGEIVEMVLIMPDSGKYAFYRDSELTPGDKDNTGPWRTQLTEELRGVAQATYRIKKEARFNGLTGNSMGAYGSIMAGTTRPDLYSSIGLHMGYLPTEALESLKTLADSGMVTSYDFYLDCGLQDQTVGTAGTIAIHEYLDSIGKAHGYDLRDGTHSSAFYMSGMAASMKMHSEHFKDAGLSSIPSDGGSSVSVYSVVVEETENGSVSLSDKSVAKGKKVTIDVEAEEGYVLESITVTDAKGNEIEVTEKNGKYVFVMPASKITVNAEFVRGDHDEVCPSAKFDDLDTEAWYHDAVDYVLTNGMMAGVSGDEFAPGMNVTRGMVVQILWAMEGKPAAEGELTFEDVAADAWYAEAVRWAAAEGIVSGYSAESFGPADAVTREQMAVMLAGYARYKGADMSDAEETNILSYEDFTEISDWAFSGLQWACSEGILSGKSGGYLDPTGTATRMEAAQMLMKFAAVLAD